MFTSLLWVLCTLRGAAIVTGRQLVFHEQTDLNPILDEEFSAWLEETGKGWGMKGVAVAVVRKNNDGGWMTETKGYGVADRWGTSVDEETLFSIGSNSKLFAALAIGMLAENTSLPLSWDSKVKDIVPDTVWGLQDKFAEDNVNIIDMLSHRTGLPAHDLSYSRGNSLMNTLSKLRYLRPSAEFRDIFQYNNQMYSLASYIVSLIANTSFVDYVTRELISPLGLISTTYDVDFAEKSGKLADGFVNAGQDAKKGEGRRRVRFRPVPYWNREGGREIIAGPGGVISNARDLVVWLQTLLLSGCSPITGEQVIPTSVVDRVARGVTVPRDPATRTSELGYNVYGMGQRRYTYQGHELIEHNGGTIGHYSLITRAPSDGIGLAILTNWEDGAKFMEVIKYRLLEKAMGLPVVDWDERLHKLETESAARQTTGLSTSTNWESVLTHTLEGLYFNPAYGTLTLCVYPTPSPPHVPHKQCAEQFPEALLPLLNSSESVLFAAWPKVWSTHLMLRHTTGDHKFLAVPVNVFPAPFSLDDDVRRDDDDVNPFAATISGISWPAQFMTRKDTTGKITVEGMAWTGMWEDVKSSKGDGMGGADVWFYRVA